MQFNFIYSVILSLLFINIGFAQQTPGAEQSEPISIVGATAHIGNGKVIENSLIVFEDGKITEVSENSPGKQVKGQRIEASGKHVYPGFIAPNSTLGLAEVDAVKASVDMNEVGDFLPHVRSLVAYNATSKVVESVRPNGVLIGQITPRGGRILGTSSIVQFDAWNWEDALIKENDGIHLNWPSSISRSRWWMGEDPGIKANDKYEGHLRELDDFFAGAKAHLDGDKKETNLPFEAMSGLFEGKQKLYIHANREKEIRDILEFKNKHSLENIVLVGGYYSYKLADELKANAIAVLIGRINSLPQQEDEDYDFPYKMAHLLHEKGVLVGLENSGDMERMQTRNLPFYAGTQVNYGMDKEEALQLITLNTAKILGVDDQLGTLEVGKDATLFVSEGDALDIKTNKLIHAFINGRQLSLETHQTQLAEEYEKRFGVE